MSDPRQILRPLCQQRLGLVGIGNVDWGDDGLGVRLAQAIQEDLDRVEAAECQGLAEVRPSELKEPPQSRSRRQEAQKSETPDVVSYGEYQGLAEVRPSGCQVLVAGTEPERCLGPLTDGHFKHVLFLDAVDFGGAPGSVLLMNAADIARRHPQVSTHKISLGLLASMIEADGTARAWLLGVQPRSLAPAADLSPEVRATVDALRRVLVELLEPQELRPRTPC